MANKKKEHLHIRWGKEDEERLKKIMDAYNLNRSEAVRSAVHMIADQIHIRGYAAVTKDV